MAFRKVPFRKVPLPIFFEKSELIQYQEWSFINKGIDSFITNITGQLQKV